MSTHADCIFCKIIAGQIPSKKVYEDEELLAFHDIRPAAPVHVLVVPKTHIVNLQGVGAEHHALLGRMLAKADEIAALAGCRPGAEGGFRVVINNGADGGQEVYHLHMHIMGGPRPWRAG
jgi:histidine triad (HIT) family protein